MWSSARDELGGVSDFVKEARSKKFLLFWENELCSLTFAACGAILTKLLLLTKSYGVRIYSSVSELRPNYRWGAFLTGRAVSSKLLSEVLEAQEEAGDNRRGTMDSTSSARDRWNCSPLKHC